MKTIIIGGIAAGMSAAAKLKRLAKDEEVIVYEKGDIVSFGACGLPYFTGGFFDDANEMIARTPEKFRETGIAINTRHEVLDIDFENNKLTIKNLEDGSILNNTYDKLMIATGARAIIPPIKNINKDNVYTLKTMEDGIKIREALNKDTIKKVTIIGAGFIGLEAVEAALHMGKEVSVVQLQDRVLKEVFDKEITDLLDEELKSKNVNLYLNEVVTEIIGEASVEKVVTDKREIQSDLVILATGVRPNTDFLDSSKINLHRNGAIIVDSYGRTSVPNVYSAGDCATIINKVTGAKSYVPLATGANKLGRIVGENLAGENNEFQGSLASSCIKVLDMEAARTGLSEKEAKDLDIDYKITFIKDMNQTSYYPGRYPIYIKLIYDAKSKVILGGQVAGYKDAVQRCNVLAACIFSKLTTSQLGMLDLCYAPPFSRTWDALNVAGNVSK